MDITTLGGHRTIQLGGFYPTWEEARRCVLAPLFGEMVKRAVPVVERWHGDLFWDAQWIGVPENLVGPEPTFRWMVRSCGTNIGDSAQAQERISTLEPRVLYQVTLTQERGMWSVTFNELVRVEGPGAAPA